MEIPAEVKRAGAEAIATYRRALPYGERWAAMVATQTPPGTSGTDRAFMEGRMNNQQLDDMPLRQARYVADETKRAGINISGKHYVGGLADHRGWRDPEAWVSNNDDVLKVAHKRRLSVSGTVNYDPGPADPKRKLISETIVREEVAKAKRQNPSAKASDLREKVIEKHAYRAKGRGV
jgi:hypothetical protein